MGKRELVALLILSPWCLAMVGRLFLAMPRGCLRFVVVVFPDHTHLLLFMECRRLKMFVQNYCNCSYNSFAPNEKWLQGGTSFVDLLCFFCLVFAMPMCASVYMCFVVTCWERADLLALVCGV